MSAGITEWLMSTSPSLLLTPSSSSSLILSCSSPSHLGPSGILCRRHDGRVRAQLNYLVLFALFHHGNRDFRFTRLRHGRTLTTAVLSSWISAWWPHINLPLGIWSPRLSHWVYCHGDKTLKSHRFTVTWCEGDYSEGGRVVIKDWWTVSDNTETLHKMLQKLYQTWFWNRKLWKIQKYHFCCLLLFLIDFILHLSRSTAPSILNRSLQK